MPQRRRRYSAERKEQAVRLVVDDGRPVPAVARELGIGEGTVRRWARVERERRRADDWAELVTSHFEFVTQYGFALTDVDASDWWEERVTYRSPVSALAVIRSLEFKRVDVQLMRLVDGELPEYPIFVVDSVALNTFFADDLVALRRADADELLARQRGLSPPEVEAQLVFWSRALREYGQDFLTGDLRVLDDLEQMVRGRARQGQQTVVVWLPDTASTADETGAIERVQAAVPEEVTVTASRYRSSRATPSATDGASPRRK